MEERKHITIAGQDFCFACRERLNDETRASGCKADELTWHRANKRKKLIESGISLNLGTSLPS